MNKPVIYVASPYTKGDPAVNTHFQMRMFDRLMNDGVVLPVVPLWTHFQHCAFPRHYKDWIEYDLALLERYDGCLRLDAAHEFANGEQYIVSESSGADDEVANFEEQGKPVFYSIADLYEAVVAGVFE